MTQLFEPTTINGMTLDNRFVRSATWEGMAGDDGSATPALTRTMTDLANGGVGLIISGHAYVVKDGQAGPWQLGMHDDGLVPGLLNMTDAVHDAGGKIVAQLAHSGHFAPKSLTGAPPQVVSDVEGLTRQPCRVLTTEDIQILITAYARAAYRARTAGFDGIQLHSAHGYLLSQFLSPAYNQRRDDYGGSVENRCRIHVEILKAIRSKVGADFPVLIKINSEDCIENGLTLVDSLEAAGRMVDAGLDGIELSGGTLTSGKLSPSRMGINKVEKEAYFKNAAEAFKKTIHVPLILVGGMRSPSVAEQTVSTGTADYISLSRPFIREPGLINRWKSGDTRPAFCTSDNLCFAPAMEGKGVQCITEQLEKKKQS